MPNRNFMADKDFVRGEVIHLNGDSFRVQLKEERTVLFRGVSYKVREFDVPTRILVERNRFVGKRVKFDWEKLDKVLKR